MFFLLEHIWKSWGMDNSSFPPDGMQCRDSRCKSCVTSSARMNILAPIMAAEPSRNDQCVVRYSGFMRMS